MEEEGTSRSPPVLSSAIAIAEPHLVRGKDLCADFIGRPPLPHAYFLTLLNLQISNKKLVRLVDASLAAIAEGWCSSVQAARMNGARRSRRDALQAAVAAVKFDAGPIILGVFLRRRSACSRRLLPTVAMQILARLPTLRSKLFAKSAKACYGSGLSSSTNP